MMTGKLGTRLLALALFVLACALGTAPARAATATEIDAAVDATLANFRKEVKGADDYLKGADGVLVMPSVKKIGFVVGGQWGEGALRIGGKTVDYYKMEVGSVGFQAGYQKASFVFLFLTKDVLEKFRAENQWTAGVEGGITVVDAAFGGSLDTLKSKSSMVVFLLDREGLAAGWSAKGTRFSKMKPQ